jgi:hypothetical protein
LASNGDNAPKPPVTCGGWLSCLLTRLFSGGGGTQDGGGSNGDVPHIPYGSSGPVSPAKRSSPKVLGAGAVAAPVIACEIVEPCGIAVDIALGGALIGVGIYNYYHLNQDLPKPPADFSTPPGPDWVWKGRGEGAWYNPRTEESLRPDPGDGHGHGPHWDYKGPGGKLRLYPDGRVEPKL